MVAKLLRIHGLVQGVGYRGSMRHEAARLNLSGWVKNRGDGTVEALVCGSTAQVALILEWVRQGPHFARVDRLAVAETEAEIPESGAFEVLSTE